jgi:hypothetical protein
MSLLAQKIVELARREVGVEEIDGTNCGPRVNEYKAATWLPANKAWPWCAAFVCWLIREAMAATGIKETATFKRPRTAGAWDFENWSLAQDGTTQTRKPHRGDIQPGDIVIFTFSHIGIATSSPDADGFIQTIEGNTDGQGSREGGAVLAKKRHISRIRSRIRFTV